MELYIYDGARKLSGIVEVFEFFRWTRRYRACGDFELRTVADAGLALLKMGNILWKSDDQEAGIIEHIELTMEEGRDIVLVRGRFASSLLGRRIVWGTEILNGDISEAVGQIIGNNVINPGIAARKISGFAYDSDNLGVPINEQVSYKNVLRVTEGLCEAADLGFKTVWDGAAGTFTFKLYRGGDSQAVFSKDYDNLLTQTYVRSELNYANAALIGGEGEGAQREMQTIDGSAGTDRREIFVDAKDLRRDDFNDNYASALMGRGQAKLAEQAAVSALDAVISPYGNYKYKQDYDLGQTVRVLSSKWGVELFTRITEIEESYDRDGRTLQILFGRGLLSLAQKLKEG